MAFSRIPSPSGPSPIPAERIARRLRENTFSSSRVVVSVAPGAVAGGKRDRQSPVAGGAGGVRMLPACPIPGRAVPPANTPGRERWSFIHCISRADMRIWLWARSACSFPPEVGEKASGACPPRRARNDSVPTPERSLWISRATPRTRSASDGSRSGSRSPFWSSRRPRSPGWNPPRHRWSGRGSGRTPFGGERCSGRCADRERSCPNRSATSPR